MVVFEQSGLFGQSSFFWPNVVVFGQKWLYLGKSDFIRLSLLYSGKCGCLRAKMVVFGQNLLYS